MSRPKILLQLDTDAAPSVFDAAVAIDAGSDHLLRHGNVTVEATPALVHGLMFTRGPDDLHASAIFIGGSDVPQAEAIYAAIKKTFFGPFRVSVLLDPSGANTTAVAAVIAAGKHVELKGSTATVLGATGPVGQRCVRLLAKQGAAVRVASRELGRAEQTCAAVKQRYPDAQLTPVATSDAASTSNALAGANVVIAAGAAGKELVTLAQLQAAGSVKVAVDLNAVPPAGIAGVEATERGVDHNGIIGYGALGVGGTKMKVHKAALRALFESNDKLFDAEEIYEIAE